MALTLEQKERLKKAIFYAQQDPKGLADILETYFGASSEGVPGPQGPEGPPGPAGADGKSVKSIKLVTTDGAVTSGTAVLSDESEVPITVSTSGT